MHTYSQGTGIWMHDGQLVGRGYSGADPDPKRTGEAGEGKNHPEMQAIPNVGPIPLGRYRIGLPHFHKTAGPYTMRLHPLPGTAMFGRDGFLCHGDSASAPGTASHGCVVLPRIDRMRIGESGDEDLEVVI